MWNFRPESLSEFIGQEGIVKELSIYISSIKQRKDIFPHTLFIGAPGLGKTTLARLIALELKRDFKITSGPVIDKPGTLAGILTNLKEGDILFIDEIHRMPKPCQEVLYSAMEDFALDILIGKNQSAKTIRLSLPKFTLIGATNKPNLLLSPLIDRFLLSFKLDYYKEEELKYIILKASGNLGLKLSESSALKLAKAGKGIPRQTLNLLRRLREFLYHKKKPSKNDPLEVEDKDIEEFFKLLDIDEWGLTHSDRRCLLTLYKFYKGGPVGLNALALASKISPEELETLCEPALIRLGLMARTRRGRVITKLGEKYLKERNLLHVSI
ncbi:MAG: Holliday junction branch migration DNA helicase RuvB [Caldimicrobium sp.]